MDCWKCCLFNDIYNCSTTRLNLCQCKQNSYFCNWDSDCSSGYFCNTKTSICKSCFYSNGSTRCNGFNGTGGRDGLFKAFLKSSYPAGNHSFWSRKGLPGTPCSSPTQPCITGYKCAPEIYGGLESDVVLTGGLSELNKGSLCVKCSPGEYCPNGLTSFICPKSYYCPTNSTQKILCPAGFYCPEGTSTPLSCKYAQNMWAGNYCPPGSSEATILCPGGYYCPTPNISIPCQKHQLCRPQSINPSFCPPLTFCPEATSIPKYPAGYVWLSIGLFLVFAFIAMVVKYFNKRRTRSEITVNTSYDFLSNSQPICSLDFHDVSVDKWLAPSSGEFIGGQMNAIIGSSGCGKSTLIELIRGRVKGQGTIYLISRWHLGLGVRLSLRIL